MTNRGDLRPARISAVLRRRRLWLFAPFVVSVALAGYLASVQEPTYTAEARVLLDKSAAQDAINGGRRRSDAFLRRRVANEINLAEADVVTAEVRSQLGIGADEPLPDGEIFGDEEADVLFFEFSGSTPEEAAEVANTWAGAYIEVRAERLLDSVSKVTAEVEQRLELLRADRAEVRADLDRLESQLVGLEDSGAPAADEAAVTDPVVDSGLEQQRQLIERQIDRQSRAIAGELSIIDSQIQSKLADLATLELNAKLASSGEAQLVQAAAPPPAPSSLIPSVMLAIGAILGLLVGIGLVLLVENLSKVIHVPSDVERLGIPVLGTIPVADRQAINQEPALAAHLVPTSGIADASQRLRTEVQFALGESPERRTVLVTSPGQGEGKTTTASNLALAFAGVDDRIRLIDANLRSPRIHEVFAIDQAPGFGDVVVGAASLAEAEVPYSTPGGSISVVPAGNDQVDPTVVMTSPSLRELFKTTAKTVDLTVVDGCSLSAATDMLTIVPQVAGTVLVVRAGHTRSRDVIGAVDDVHRSGGRVLGVVVTFVGHRKVHSDHNSTPAARGPRSAQDSPGDPVLLG